MEGLQNLLRKASKEYESASRSLSENVGARGGGVSSLSSEQSGVLVARAPRCFLITLFSLRYNVSALTCLSCLSS